MEGISVITGIQPQPLTAELFQSFVTWIDRSEKTTRSYLTNLRQFMAWLRFSAVLQPTREDILSYRDWLGVEHDAIEQIGRAHV